MSSTVNYLADLGYNGLALPRTNVGPLTVMLMERDRPWRRVGRLDQVILPGGAGLPPVEGPESSADVGGTVTRTVEIGVALKLLTSFLNVFGSSAGLEAKYQGATEADISFERVTTQYIDLVPLDEYLAKGRVNDDAASVMLYLNDGKCIVVTDVLRSPKITMTARRDKSSSFEVDLPEIEQAVKADVNVSAESKRTSTISFEAKADDDPGVIFGVQALQLNYSGNVFYPWRTVEAAKTLRDPNASEEARKAAVEEPALIDTQLIGEIEDVELDQVPPPEPAGT